MDRLTAQRSVYVTLKIGRTACGLARVGIGDEAAARVMTCMCHDVGLGTVIYIYTGYTGYIYTQERTGLPAVLSVSIILCMYIFLKFYSY